ncbi:S8 family peptidase [Glycocaulis abyssi]|uniref:S8 family peptidase n=1 Tax=Glycocaulis abyssi TaxID=1433403 RepID=UPI00352A1D71
MIVAVVDTGINQSHPEFTGRISAASSDIVSNRGVEDIDGHGTGVAGVIAAARNNIRGHGVAFEATILAIRTDSVGSCENDGGDDCLFSDRNTANAIDYAVSNGARIINLSLGRSPDPNDDRSRTFAAMRRAAEAGVFMVMSSGNREDADTPPTNSPSFPASLAAHPGSQGFAVAVGAVDENAVRANYSNGALGVENWFLSAPGSRILTPFLNNSQGDPRYVLYSGTSFAAPHVAGALALLIDAFPNLTGNDALQILLDTALDLGPPGPDAQYGMGLIDLAAAFQPIGTTSVAFAGTTAGPVPVEAILADPAGAAGDWIWADGLLDRALLEDRYGRAFSFDTAPPRASGDTALGAFETAAGNALAHVSTTRVGPAAVSMRMQPGRLHALTNLPAETYASQPDLSFSYRQGGLSVAAGRGFSAEAPIRMAGGSVLSRVPASGAVAGLAGNEQWSSVSYDTGTLGFSARTASSQLGSFSAAGAHLRHRGHTFGLETGSSQEAFQALGGPLASRFGGTDETDTQFVGWMWSGPVGGGWRASARFEQASASASLPSGIALTRDIRASAWSAGAERPVAGGLFGLTLNQPLRVEQGEVSVMVPVALDEDYAYIYEERRASLSPSGREISLEASWRRNLTERVDMTLAARLTDQPGHIASAPSEGLGWAAVRARW